MDDQADYPSLWQMGSRYFFERLGGCVIAFIALALAHDPFARVFLAVLAVGSFFDDGSVPGWFVGGLGVAVLVGAVFDVVRGFLVAASAAVALGAGGLVPAVRQRVPVIDLCAMAVVALLIRSWGGVFTALAILIVGAGVAVVSRRPRFPLVPYAAVAAAFVASQGW